MSREETPESTTGYALAPDAALQRLLDDPGAMTQADLSQLMAAVHRYLRVSSSWMSDAQIEDVSMSAVARLLEMRREGQLDRSRNVMGYLLRIARNTAVSLARSANHSRTVLSPVSETGHWQLPEDDNVARHLNAQADAQIVRQALALAVQEGDKAVVRVVSYVLDELQRSGVMPSHRAIATQVGLSHTGVAKALGRFADLVTRLGADH